jgi:general nucleoside transport system permease protein
MLDVLDFAVIARAFAFGTTLLWGALAAITSERAGVVNLGMEGMMILGALAAFATAKATDNLGLALLVGALVGMLAASLHALVAVWLKANQFVSGLALTMLGLGLTGLLGKRYEGQPLLSQFENFSVPLLKDLPMLGQILFTDQNILTYAALLVALALWLLLYRSRWGIIWRSVGEYPAAADAQGINVTTVRVMAVLAGGMLAGTAGAYLTLAYQPAWTSGITGGLGWIAVGIAIFAAWNPLQAIAGALFFGLLYALSFRLQTYIQPEFLKMAPYAFVIVVLALNAIGRGRKPAGAPAALGQPYVRGER